MMKKVHIIRYFTMSFLVGLLGLASCNEPIYDFGYDGQLSGKVVDSGGNVVSGDTKLSTFAVETLGELDQTSMVMRIKPDGTYANSKLYPQIYEIQLVGPFYESPVGPVTIDLTGGKSVVEDFQVTPFLTLAVPSVSGSPTSTQVMVDYNIVPNGDRAPEIMEIYCSTVSWPTRTTGTGMGYFTETVSVDENQGTATISGLQPKTKYFIRVGARAEGQNLFNHSGQISFTTP